MGKGAEEGAADVVNEGADRAAEDDESAGVDEALEADGNAKLGSVDVAGVEDGAPRPDPKREALLDELDTMGTVGEVEGAEDGVPRPDPKREEPVDRLETMGTVDEVEGAEDCGGSAGVDAAAVAEDNAVSDAKEKPGAGDGAEAGVPKENADVEAGVTDEKLNAGAGVAEEDKAEPGVEPKPKAGTEVVDDELGGVAKMDEDDWGIGKVNAGGEAAGKVEGVARIDEELAGSDGGTLVAEGKAGGVEPNRADDEAAVDILPNRDPLPNAEAEEGANENPEDVPGLGEAPNNN